MDYGPEIDSYLKAIRFPTFKGQALRKDSFQSPGDEIRPKQPLLNIRITATAAASKQSLRACRLQFTDSKPFRLLRQFLL